MQKADEPRIEEEQIDPHRRVIDSHHHLHDRVPQDHDIGRDGRFLVDDYAELIGDCNVVATICVEARSMYRAGVPDEIAVIGETEFLNGQAAMAASGNYGPCKVGAGIVAKADLRFGSRIRETLEAHKIAAPERFRGIRQEAGWDEDESIVGGMFDAGPQVYLRDDFREGFAELAPLGLSFDAFVLSPQLGDVIDLARRFPETSIILDHLALPVGIGRFKGKLAEEFGGWKSDMATLAASDNVTVKLGGLGTFITAFPSFDVHPPCSSAQLADEWRPYVESAIELFGADRCMFESNLPTDKSGSFASVLNAFKRITEKCSETEKDAVFSGTASRVYRLNLPA